MDTGSYAQIIQGKGEKLKFVLGKRFAAYLTMSRLSNIPTVCSNCLVGISLAGGCGIDMIFFVLSALFCYYIAGMFLNDAYDARWDAQNRPERPIPQGMVSTKKAFQIAWSLLFLSNIFALCGSILNDSLSYKIAIWCFILTSSIFLYNKFHKKYIYSPLLMALCRVCVYCIAAFMIQATTPGGLYAYSAVLGSYILGISYIARQETAVKLVYRWPLLFLFFPVVYTLPIDPFSFFLWLSFLGYVLYCSYGIMKKNGQIALYVGLLIAGISLLDSLILLSLGAIFFALISIICFFLTIIFHRIIPGT